MKSIKENQLYPTQPQSYFRLLKHSLITLGQIVRNSPFVFLTFIFLSYPFNYFRINSNQNLIVNLIEPLFIIFFLVWYTRTAHYKLSKKEKVTETAQDEILIAFFRILVMSLGILFGLFIVAGLVDTPVDKVWTILMNSSNTDELVGGIIDTLIIIFALYVFYRIIFYPQLIVIDKKSRPLRDSWGLSKGNWWRVFLSISITIILGLNVIVLIPYLFIEATSLVLTFSDDPSSNFAFVLHLASIFIISLSGTIFHLFYIVFVLLLINDIRHRKAFRTEEQTVVPDNAEITG